MGGNCLVTEDIAVIHDKLDRIEAKLALLVSLVKPDNVQLVDEPQRPEADDDPTLHWHERTR